MAKQWIKQFKKYTEVKKVDEELGLVFGWAIICKEEGEPYFDLQGDHITEDAMFQAATDFMEHSRVMNEMHEGGDAGKFVFAFPMTEEVQKAFGIECDKTGLLVAAKPDPETLEKFKSGELTGFSIEGVRGEDEEV